MYMTTMDLFGSNINCTFSEIFFDEKYVSNDYVSKQNKTNMIIIIDSI